MMLGFLQLQTKYCVVNARVIVVLKIKQRLLCVHILPLLFLLSLLMFEDLAEHMLLELAACMNADIWDQSIWCDEDFEWMKTSIISLMEAAGEVVGTHDSSSVTV